MKEPKGRDPARRIDVGPELSSCPDCGSSEGFHVGLCRRERRLEVELICPSCRARFVTGEWTVSSGEPRPFDPEIDIGP